MYISSPLSEDYASMFRHIIMAPWLLLVLAVLVMGLALWVAGAVLAPGARELYQTWEFYRRFGYKELEPPGTWKARFYPVWIVLCVLLIVAGGALMASWAIRDVPSPGPNGGTAALTHLVAERLPTPELSERRHAEVIAAIKATSGQAGQGENGSERASIRAVRLLPDIAAIVSGLAALFFFYLARCLPEVSGNRSKEESSLPQKWAENIQKMFPGLSARVCRLLGWVCVALMVSSFLMAFWADALEVWDGMKGKEPSKENASKVQVELSAPAGRLLCDSDWLVQPFVDAKDMILYKDNKDVAVTPLVTEIVRSIQSNARISQARILGLVLVGGVDERKLGGDPHANASLALRRAEKVKAEIRKQWEGNLPNIVVIPRGAEIMAANQNRETRRRLEGGDRSVRVCVYLQ